METVIKKRRRKRRRRRRRGRRSSIHKKSRGEWGAAWALLKGKKGGEKDEADKGW